MQDVSIVGIVRDFIANQNRGTLDLNTVLVHVQTVKPDVTMTQIKRAMRDIKMPFVRKTGNGYIVKGRKVPA